MGAKKKKKKKKVSSRVVDTVKTFFSTATTKVILRTSVPNFMIKIWSVLNRRTNPKMDPNRERHVANKKL